MNNLSMLNHSFLIYVLIFLLHVTLATSDVYTADTIFLSCGAPVGNVATPDGRNWTGDQGSKFGPMEPANKKSSAVNALLPNPSVESVPYMTARISRNPFSYSFPLTSGQKFIRLHFYPTTYQGGFHKYKDFLNVRAGPHTLLWNFSASFYADAWGTETFIREYALNVDDSQQLNITFSPFLEDSNDSYAFINGIEIVSMPINIYYTPPGDDRGLKVVHNNGKFSVQNNTALENMCRLNVGGNFLSSNVDTGMYREWKPDDDYNWYQNGVIPRYPDISLNYSKIPSYTATDDLYRSARSMGRDEAKNLLSNLTWLVPVDHGFNYLVRLHFCEIVEDVIAQVNDRRFIISIDGEEVEKGFDVVESSGGVGTPIYKDYIVRVGDRGNTSDYYLFITLRPNASSLHKDVILNGLETFKLSDSSGTLVGPNLPPSSPQPGSAPRAPLLQLSPIEPSKSESNKRTVVIIAVVSSVVALLIMISLISCFVIWRIRKRKDYDSHYESLVSCCSFINCGKGNSSKRTKATSSLPEELCRHFSLTEIKAATNNFHESLIVGGGGFGKVYRGQIDGGATVVAIKRLNPESTQGFDEFKTEIEMLSNLRHVHLVSLIGYCNDQGEMILVYDFMTNGTVQSHLYGTENQPLPWKKRLEICVGAARGLDYLHTGVTKTIIHRDVKSTNILLDENWVAKVSDFGLSRIGLNDVAVSTLVKGTWGYLDPEYARRHQLTDKSDVYSFGVVLLEILSARKPLNRRLAVEEQWNLVNWARQCMKVGAIHQIIDPHLIGQISPECFTQFMEVAERCVRDGGSERPSMHDVMENLEFALELQQAADAEKEQKNPGVEYGYPEVSFQPPAEIEDVVGESEVESSKTSGLTLDTKTSVD